MSDVLKYGATAKWLHWLIAFIVIIMLIFGRTLESLPLSEREQMIMGHSGLGTLVLLLMLLRWGWRLSHEPPGAIGSMGLWQTRLSKTMHWSLYILLVLQPILGIFQAMFITDYEVLAFGVINYSGLATDSADMARVFHVLHGINATVLSVLVVGHIGASLYHHFFQKDSILRRMLPYGKP
ncbi:MAG: cytochrome b/b6 domain-containing protein [bacterium]|nr:cytochrome b [Gammaproteobacteria bacterium]HIL96575.1 cytochrome b [Pseudomonadales bacterium]